MIWKSSYEYNNSLDASNTICEKFKNCVKPNYKYAKGNENLRKTT